MQGVCKEHRKLDYLDQLTGYAPFDIDHITADQANSIMELLSGILWVKESHRSSRGGIHLAAAMGVIDCPKEDGSYDKEYKHRNALIAAELATLTGVPVDGQCKDCVRGMFVSYDPDAFLRPDEEVECFTTRKWLSSVLWMRPLHRKSQLRHRPISPFLNGMAVSSLSATYIYPITDTSIGWTGAAI